MASKVEIFFRQHPIFVHQTFAQALSDNGAKNPNTLKNILAHHLHRGHIVRIRRGLFASIPYGANPKTHPINPFLIAANLTDDAVVAYHSALAFYGVAYSSSYRFIYLTAHKPKMCEFRDESYQASLFPSALINNSQTHSHVNTEDVNGMGIHVTSKERTLVDVMDRPLLGGGWEEIWRSLDMIERLKVDHIVDYALLLENATTIAKVGFYLEQRQIELNVAHNQLAILQKHCPTSPHYMDGVSKEKCKFIKQWNLMVPLSLINRNWEENLQWEPKA